MRGIPNSSGAGSRASWCVCAARSGPVLTLAWLLTAFTATPVEGQDLEPRRWSHLPTGAFFIAAGYRYGTGDILIDPTLEVAEAEFEQHDGTVSSVYSFSWWDKPMRIEAVVPYGWSRWQGLLAGQPASVTRQGLRDATLRLSMNLTGAPALSGPAFAAWQVANPIRTSTGLALQVTAPTGEYLEDKLLNLGNNRWVVRPQAGILHTHNHWQFELTGSLSLYSDNDEFLVTRTQETRPLLFVQAHAIRSFGAGLWASVSWGATMGGEHHIDGVDRNDSRGENIWAISLGLPINRQQGIKLAWLGSKTHEPTGYDSSNLILAWSMMLSP